MPHGCDHCRILVVDDNPAIHEDFRKIFAAAETGQSSMEKTPAAVFDNASPRGTGVAGFEIDTAFQGEEGLEMIRAAARQQRPYMMAFLDVRMPPGRDGGETTARAWQEFPELPIVICTGFSDYTWEEMVSRLGHSDRWFVLKKPFDVGEVKQLAVAITKRIEVERAARKADELDSIFDKFIQSSKTGTGAGGTGLGLSICREIIAAHHGRIWAENRREGGALFCLEIPRDRQERANRKPNGSRGEQ